MDLQYPNKDSKIPVPETGAGGSLLLPDSYVYRDLLPLSCPMGTVSIMHFDVGHSVLANLMERMRLRPQVRVHAHLQPERSELEFHRRPLADAGAAGRRAPTTRSCGARSGTGCAGSGDRFARGTARDSVRAAGPDSGSVDEQLAALRSGADLERARAASELGFAAGGRPRGLPQWWPNRCVPRCVTPSSRSG